ncbi:MAG TPA: hypothetical protein VEA16_12270 [Vicinamibacterales bacterium]|nr:hypothetical protein [Vicinamibacterales bacterium]
MAACRRPSRAARLTMMPAIALLASCILLAVFAASHFARRSAAVIAAICFLTMPLVWQAASGSAPQIVLVPAMLASLICFDRYRQKTGELWLGLAGAFAAAMMYLHLAGMLIAPAYASLVAVGLLMRADRARSLAVFAIGLAVLAVPLVVINALDSARFTAAVNAYGLYDATRLNPLQGVRDMSSWVGLTVRSEVYWDYFSPALWFLGRGGLIDSVVGSRVFVLPLAIPFVRGLLAYIVYPRDLMDWVVLAAFLAAPAATAALGQPPTAPRLIVVAPLVAIIATRGCYPGALRMTAAASPSAPAMAATSR